MAGRRGMGRLEAFSDGVFAIAITILALELRVPHVEQVTASNLARALLDEWPTYFAFLLSFSTILIIWINHHARMALLERIDGLLMFGNGLLLMMVAALSFPGIVAVIVFAFTLSAHEFIYALAFISSTAEKTISIGIPTELIRGDVFFWQSLQAAVVFVVLPIAFVFNLLLGRFISDFTMGAVKG